MVIFISETVEFHFNRVAPNKTDYSYIKKIQNQSNLKYQINPINGHYLSRLSVKLLLFSIKPFINSPCKVNKTGQS